MPGVRPEIPPIRKNPVPLTRGPDYPIMYPWARMGCQEKGGAQEPEERWRKEDNIPGSIPTPKFPDTLR